MLSVHLTLTIKENFPVLTQNDAFADCTLSDAAMGENPKVSYLFL